MNDFEIGFKQAFVEIIGGIVTLLILKSFAETGLIPQYYIMMMGLIIIVMNVLFIFSMTSWGILYTFGWLLGSFILVKSGLMEIIDLILCIVLPIVLLVMRFVYWIK